jgi:class 3 adenylate cyclase/tetratricopeptide (TPR) repeat protein
MFVSFICCQPKEMDRMADPVLTEVFASYVPRLIKKRVLADPAPIESPVAEDFEAVVLFADISGFTLLTERLAERGLTGVETLARILNEYFGQLIDIIHDYGGDVVKFAGDAVIATWSVEREREGDLTPPDRRRWTLHVADCALKIRDNLVNYKFEGSSLYLKLAIAAGQIGHVHVGGVFNRWEFLLTGAPLIELGIANNLAKASDILITPSAWGEIRTDCIAELLRFPFKEQASEAGKLEGLKYRTTLSTPWKELTIPEDAQGSLRAYIPGAIVNRLVAGQSGWIAELRRITVLFINLPDIDEEMSLENAQTIARLIQRSVYRYEGSINKINVDDKGITIVAALGLPPFAHEDDPARGAMAALTIRKELINLGVHSYIGVTTGRIFCGSIGNDIRREYTIIGNAVNLSARLMGAGKNLPGLVEKALIPILCDRSTYDSAKEVIEFELLPPQRVKGRPDPVEVYHPLEQKKSIIRATTELIGRQEEKALLANALQELQRGATIQTVILHGEAGIGKSRLTDDLLRQAAALGVKAFVGHGDPIEKSNPYYAWRPVFNRLFDLEEILIQPQLSEGDREEIRGKVFASLQEVDPDLARYMPLLDVVLPVQIPDNEFTSAMTGEIRGGNIRELLLRLLNHEAGKAPVLVALEDLHWLDSASWMLLMDVHEKARPVLLALNTRPLSEPVRQEFKQISAALTTRFVRLDAMRLDDVEALVCQRLGVKSIPAQIGRLIREKSEGNPFFAEELAYAMRDTRVLLIENQECRLSESFPNLESIMLPETLQAAITNRIDSLNPSQQLTLKVASVIGRIFAFRVLQAIHPIETDRPALGGYMDTLTRLSLTLIESETPDLAYIFKHAVTQEVAYNLMLYSQRRQLHQAVAEWIERNYERDLGSYYALLAYHWTQAAQDPEPASRKQVIRKAVEYLEKAGDQSLNNFANAEAIQFFSELIAYKDEVLPGKLRLGQWYRKLGMAHLGLGQLEEAKGNFLTALATLGERVPASNTGLTGGLLAQLGRQAGHRLWPKAFRWKALDEQQKAIRLEIVYILDQYAVALFLIGEPNPLPMFYSVVAGLNIAESMEDTPALSNVYAQMGAILGFIPVRSQAKYYTEQWSLLNERFNHPGYFVSSAISLATVESGIGAWDQVKERMERVVEICNELGNNRQAGEAFSFMASNAVIEGDVNKVSFHNASLIESARRRNNPVQWVWSYQWAGAIALSQGKFEEALANVEKALAVMEKTPVGEVAEFVIYGIRLAAQWHSGEQQKALDAAKQLLDRAAKMQVVDYSIYVGFFHIMDVVFLALEQAYRENRPAAEKAEWMEYAKRSIKIMQAYARVFTVGEPAYYRYSGWVQWHQGKKEKAYQSWRTAVDKARQIPMHYEEGMSGLALGMNLPADDPEREGAFEKAKGAFRRGGFGNWVETVEKAMSR